MFMAFLPGNLVMPGLVPAMTTLLTVFVERHLPPEVGAIQVVNICSFGLRQDADPRRVPLTRIAFRYVACDPASPGARRRSYRDADCSASKRCCSDKRRS